VRILLFAVPGGLFGSAPGHADLIVNGGFEEPALAGNGDQYSDNYNGQGFLTSMPGWTFPTNWNSFYLEH
jgi:hypothetical protein